LISIHELIHELVLDDAEDVPSSAGVERAFPVGFQNSGHGRDQW
jgi:hypothetical protein